MVLFQVTLNDLYYAKSPYFRHEGEFTFAKTVCFLISILFYCGILQHLTIIHCSKRGWEFHNNRYRCVKSRS